ncbi:MAG: peptidoglycan-binding domain-containing protein [Chthoniobacterales bacterium]
MKNTWALVFLLSLGAGPLVARADQTTSAVQQSLKDQGFYYGAVNGQKNADTTAALRRYQIRNGLQITGDIDAETLRSLGVGRGKAAAPPAPPAQARATVPPTEDYSDANNAGQSAELPDDNAPRPAGPRRGPDGIYAPGQRTITPSTNGVFDGTPYEIAPPDLQRHVIVGAQSLLARAGYYRSGIDGQFGPGTVAALRAFQSRSGIAPDGRLNMETLSALGLLPGQHGLRLPRRRPLLRRPVYRGQWIPE